MTALVCLAPDQGNIAAVTASEPLKAFDPLVVDFLEALSNRLLKGADARAFPELVALGFWLRKNNIHSFFGKAEGFHKPLGTVVHFTPSNVDTMFVYSWVCSLLAGNKNIIRVASRESELQRILFLELKTQFSNPLFSRISETNLFVRFERDSGYSEKLSLLADARVIWGGDETVSQIKAMPSQPRCRDISFADRYSAALLNGDELQTEQDCEALAALLWRDIQPYDQQACSSPKFVFWQGNSDLLDMLLAKLNTLAKGKDAAIQDLNEHLVTSQLVMAANEQGKLRLMDRVCALQCSEFSMELLDWHSHKNLFFIIPVNELGELAYSLGSKLQTLSHWGIDPDSLLKIAENPSINGIDRIVPVGQALDFHPLWDGYDLMTQLSRVVFFNP